MRVAAVPFFLIFLVCHAGAGFGQDSKPQDNSSSSSSRTRKIPKAAPAESGLDRGGIVGAVYRNKTFGLSCRIPAGWVLRTEEMNAREDPETPDKNARSPQNPEDAGHPSAESSAQETRENNGGRVLLAAFSRPPAARGVDVNGSIIIAVEKQSSYPGLTEAVQYLGPLTEVAQAQGFSADEDPYEVAMGPKTLVRADFHKDVGTRVMRQSTMAFLARGYAVSITVIAGTEDEVEELLDGVSFTGK